MDFAITYEIRIVLLTPQTIIFCHDSERTPIYVHLYTYLNDQIVKHARLQFTSSPPAQVFGIPNSLVATLHNTFSHTCDQEGNPPYLPVKTTHVMPFRRASAPDTVRQTLSSTFCLKGQNNGRLPLRRPKT